MLRATSAARRTVGGAATVRLGKPRTRGRRAGRARLAALGRDIARRPRGRCRSSRRQGRDAECADVGDRQDDGPAFPLPRVVTVIENLLKAGSRLTIAPVSTKVIPASRAACTVAMLSASRPGRRCRTSPCSPGRPATPMGQRAEPAFLVRPATRHELPLSMASRRRVLARRLSGLGLFVARRTCSRDRSTRSPS
jgi:hypothetical protein